MKRVKCYGKKETRLIETSATKRFFGDLSKNLSNSYEDKSIQAHVCEDHNLEKSSEQGLSKSRNGFNNDDSDILANWRMPFLKFKYGKCKIKKSPTKKKYCKIGKQKNISKNISSARKSPTKKKYCKIERKKISKNVTSTPASNKTINLNAYFDKKFNDETAVSVESSNEKLNQKKAVDSSPENLSVRSYILSSDDTGICIMNDGSVHHLIKTSINVTPLTKRQLRYNLILSSNIRNKMKQSRKKLKLHNSAEHSVNIEDSSSELEIVLNEDIPKYVTCNTDDKEVFDEEDNNLVLNEDNNKYMTSNSVTCNTSENENNIEETEQNSKLQNSDEHVINFENNCVLSLLNLKEVKKVNSVTCNIQYGCGISTHMNMKESKACNLHDQGNEDIPKYVTCNTDDEEVFDEEDNNLVLNEDNNKYMTSNSVTCNTSENENNIEETEQNSKLQNSDEHVINFENNCVLSLLNLKEVKKVNSVTCNIQYGCGISTHMNMKESKACNLHDQGNEDIPKYVTCNTDDEEVFDEEDNNLVLNEDNNKYMTSNSVTCNTSENENNIEETEQNSKLQNSDEHVINFENNCVLSLLNLKEVKKVNSVTCNIQYGCGISTHMNMKESKACNLHDQGNEDIPKYVTYNTGHKEDNNKYMTLNSVTCNTSEKENNIEETEQNSKLQSSAEHIINFKNDCALSLLSPGEIKKEDETDCNTSEKENNIEETEQNSKLQSSDERMLLSVDEIKKEDETFEKSAIMIEACDGLFKTTPIKIQNIYLKKQETTTDQVSGDQVSEMTPLFQNEKTFNKETIIQAILKLTTNRHLVDFNEAYEWSCYTAQRMGGSSFAELFSLSTEESKRILKIIVVESEQIKLMNLLAEVKIFKCLNMLRNEGPNHCMNFCELKRVMMVRGEFPSLLKEAWVDDTSDSYAFDPRHYDATQMYLIFEMADGGTCLSHHMPKTQKEALSIMLQVGLAMAIAEEALLFEHRDLHSENILVKKTDESLSYFILRDYPIVVPNLGWEVTIIDFSLSKVVFNDTAYYNDLRFSKEMFRQQGHAQYELYRTMKKELKNKWDQTLLLTNVQWMTLVGKEMFSHLEKLGLGEKVPALLKYIGATERTLSARDFISRCIGIEHNQKIFYKKKSCVNEPEVIWIH